MNIWCKILGHKTNFLSCNVYEDNLCERKGCESIVKGLVLPPCPPMPKIKCKLCKNPAKHLIFNKGYCTEHYPEFVEESNRIVRNSFRESTINTQLNCTGK